MFHFSNDNHNSTILAFELVKLSVISYLCRSHSDWKINPSILIYSLKNKLSSSIAHTQSSDCLLSVVV